MKIKPYYFFLLACFLILFIGGLLLMETRTLNQEMNPDDVMAYRFHKNRALKTKVGSPFYGDAKFDSLRYFPLSREEVFVSDFYQIRNGDLLDLMPDRPGYDSHQVVGWIRLKKETWTDTLYILRDLEEKSDTLFFVPFTDPTNGHGSYGGGRYLNLSIYKGKPVVVNFNFAYNPYCAYNETFVCAKIPGFNHLSRAIEAGEKVYP